METCINLEYLKGIMKLFAKMKKIESIEKLPFGQQETFHKTLEECTAYIRKWFYPTTSDLHYVKDGDTFTPCKLESLSRMYLSKMHPLLKSWYLQEYTKNYTVVSEINQAEILEQK